MSDYIGHTDQELRAYKNRPNLFPEQEKAADLKAARIKQREAALIQNGALEMNQETQRRVNAAAEMVEAVRGEIYDLQQKVERGEVPPAKAKQQLEMAQKRVADLQKAAGGYVRAYREQQEQFDEPLKFADLIFKRNPSLAADRESVWDLDSRF